MSQNCVTDRSLFLAAIEIASEAERDAYVVRACGDNTRLLGEVRALLAADGTSGDLLDSPDLTPDASAQLLERPGIQIGPYMLLEQIGEGGFGVVFMAEQTLPVRRKVALKVLKPEMDSRQVIVRFEAERQALAMMDHPSIARVLDGGTTPAGRPYFVMELVKGVPITKYCDDKQLSLRERLDLFIPVCQAVQHAHQKGIIHRDLKPTNILVALFEDQPLPKVIDFGVAKATGPAMTEKTMVTQLGQLIGTLEYMSPEQAQFNQLDIDTRSDIYSLGVLLYELLTGVTPLDQAQLRTLAFDETLRIIREEEPKRPSTRLTIGKTPGMIAANRNTAPARLHRQVQGDLDWIVMRCLEKDRSRRYQTANGVAMDLRRYLDDQPVVACPPSRAYLLRKFVQRNRGPVLSAFVVLLALVGGIIGAMWGMIRAEDARQDAVWAKEEAQKRLAQTEKATEILGGVLADLDPESAEMEGVELRALLARRMSEAAQQLEGEVVGDPLVVARLQHVLGDSLQKLGQLKEAEAVLVKAGQTRERLLGGDHLDTAATKHLLAIVYRTQAKYDLAEQLFKEVLETRTDKLGPDHLDTLTSQQYLAMLYHSQTKLDLAEALLKKVLMRRIDKLGADHSDTLTSQHRLAMVYSSQGRYDLAETLCKEVLKRRAATLGADHLDTLASKNLLAVVYRSQEKFAPAEALYREVLAQRTAKLGPDHPDTIFTRHQLAFLYRSMKAIDRAIPLLEETLKQGKAKYDTDHPATITAQADLAGLYYDAGRFKEAIPLLEEAYKKRRHDSYLSWVGGKLLTAYLREGKTAQATALLTEQVGAAREQCVADSIELAEALQATGRAILDGKAYANAEPLLRESGSIVDQNAHEPWQRHRARLLLGIALVGQHKFDEAEPLLTEAYAGIGESEVQMPREAKLQLKQALEWLVQLFEAAGQRDRAEQWSKKLRERGTKSEKQ